MGSDPARRGLSNRVVAVVCAVTVSAMVGLAFAAVPFYRAFCQATGFDGTPRRALKGPERPALKRTVLVRFDANVRGLPWTFSPVQNEETVRVGASSIALFKVKNLSASPLVGRAAYNVSPESAAQYFLKIQCFCWNDQTLPPGAEKTFPVIYYVDPKFASDPDTNPLKELTLSYTFYPAPDVKPGPQQAGQKRG